jgi:hypothetical protein
LSLPHATKPPQGEPTGNRAPWHDCGGGDGVGGVARAVLRLADEGWLPADSAVWGRMSVGLACNCNAGGGSWGRGCGGGDCTVLRSPRGGRRAADGGMVLVAAAAGGPAARERGGGLRCTLAGGGLPLPCTTDAEPGGGLRLTSTIDAEPGGGGLPLPCTTDAEPGGGLPLTRTIDADAGGGLRLRTLVSLHGGGRALGGGWRRSEGGGLPAGSTCHPAPPGCTCATGSYCSTPAGPAGDSMVLPLPSPAEL